MDYINYLYIGAGALIVYFIIAEARGYYSRKKERRKMADYDSRTATSK